MHTSVICDMRDVAEGDHTFLIELHNDPVVLKNLTDPRPVTFESHMTWWHGLTSRDQRKIFTVNGIPAGICKFSSIDTANRSCMLGADLHHSFRGKRLSYPMWELMLSYCFDVLDLHRVGLTTASFNTIGQHIYETIGFRKEGLIIESLLRDGIYFDQITMYMLAEHYREDRKNVTTKQASCVLRHDVFE